MTDDLKPMLGDERMTWRCLHEDPLPEVEPCMSNFDHEVQPGFAEAIADGGHQAEYAAWNFHALVYLGAEGVYVADVHQWGAHTAFLEAASPADIMREASDRWGEA